MYCTTYTPCEDSVLPPDLIHTKRKAARSHDDPLPRHTAAEWYTSAQTTTRKWANVASENTDASSSGCAVDVKEVEDVYAFGRVLRSTAA